MMQNGRPIGLLREVRLLACFKDQEIKKLAEKGTYKKYEPYSNIVIEGELSWGIYLILSGVVGVMKSNKLTGDVHDIGQLREGNFFGEMSLVDDDPRSATVRAITETDVFYISKKAFMEYLDQSRDLKLRFFESCVKHLVSRMREVDENYVVCQYQLWKVSLKKEAS